MTTSRSDLQSIAELNISPAGILPGGAFLFAKAISQHRFTFFSKK
ncbi:hypothetical protein [Noviherbaspirillum humi]|nr:hypothetical protein [Noviherbaspirillum humi]